MRSRRAAGWSAACRRGRAAGRRCARATSASGWSVVPDSIQAKAASAAGQQRRQGRGGDRAPAGPVRPAGRTAARQAAKRCGSRSPAPSGPSHAAAAEDIGERVVPAGQGGEPPGQRQGVDHQPLVPGQRSEVFGVVPDCPARRRACSAVAVRGRAIWAAVSNRPARFSTRSARSSGWTQA